MGAFFTNFHVRSGSNKDVTEALKPLVAARAYVSSSEKNWVSVFDERADDQDEEEIQRVGQTLSRSLSTPVFAFLVHDSDVFRYWLYVNGELADKYDSRPDYFSSIAADARAKLAGKPDRVLPLCRPGTTLEALRGTLRQRAARGQKPDPDRSDPVFEEGRAAMLAAHLGISSERATMNFSDLLECEPADRRKFKLVKSPTYVLASKRGKKLFRAVERGSLAELRAVIGEGVDLTSPTSKEAIIVAARSGKLDLLRCLVDAGVNLKTRFPCGNLLAYAVGPGNSAIVRYLLERGADANEAEKLMGATPLMQASFSGDDGEVAEALVEAGADVNRPASVRFSSNSPPVNGVTPLMCAARFAALEIAKTLLKHGADKDAVDALGRNALAYAQEEEAFYERVKQRPDAVVPDLIRANSEKLSGIIQLLSPVGK